MRRGIVKLIVLSKDYKGMYKDQRIGLNMIEGFYLP